MFVIETTTVGRSSTCGPVPFPPSESSAIRPGADAFLIAERNLWGIGHMQIGLEGTEWETLRVNEGKTILVYEFLESGFLSIELEEFVKTTIKEWEEHANVKFVKRDEKLSAVFPDIRIRFGSGPSSWALTGPAGSKRTTEETVYLGGMNGLSDPLKRAIILHEFGHVLGMLHEHQSPVRGGSIILDEEAVFKHFGGDPINVRKQILNVFPTDKSNFSEFDPKSIMMYYLPDELIKEGVSIPRNLTLSPLDKAYIQLVYPRSSSKLLLCAMDAIGIQDSDAKDIIKPLTEEGSKKLISRLTKVRDIFLDYNEQNIKAKALLKMKKAEQARALRSWQVK